MLSLLCKVTDADSHALTPLHCILTCRHMTSLMTHQVTLRQADVSFTAASYLVGSINGSLTIVALILGDGTFFIFITDALRVFGLGYTGAAQ